MRNHIDDTKQRFTTEGLVEQFLECDIWREHIDYHFSDLIDGVKQKGRNDIDLADTSEEGLAKLVNLDLEEKAAIYAAQKAITWLYLESGQDEELPSVDGVKAKLLM